MRIGCDGASRWKLLGYALLACCGPREPHATQAEIAHAKQVYAQCVEDELGLDLEALEIRTNGDISVRFGPGTTDEQMALALAICEPRIGSVLEPGGVSVLGPPANLGRPGSDQELAVLVASRAQLGFEGVILVEVANERRLVAGHGRLMRDAARKPDPQTAFDCGSILKKVTASIIFLLEEEGALSREQTLAAFFAEVPQAWRNVSLDQLLTHRAGFHPYHDSEGDFEVMDRETALARIFAQRPLFEPGTDSAYSNSGYTLLAALIEVVTGRDYRSVARERVFAPLALARTGFYGDELWADGNVAIGRGADVYGLNDPAQWPAPSWALMGNGGLVSTPEDLLTLAKAMDGDRLFRPDTRAAWRAVERGGSVAGKRLVGFAGGNDFGFNALIGGVPEDAAYVVAASHVLSPVTAEILAIEVLQTLYGEVIDLESED